MSWHVLGAGSLGLLWAGRLAASGLPTSLLLRNQASLDSFLQAGTIAITRQQQSTAVALSAQTAATDEPIRRLILACKACGQAFLSVFTELTDHAGGDDSQGWALLPLAEDEERLLSTTEVREIEGRIYSTGENRTRLLKIHARGREANVFWSSGVPMLPYG